jgi:DNA-directed DNA polymerase III PolC
VDAFLHLHSEFSLLDGTASVEALCDRAREHGVSAVALADTDNAYGHVRFFRAARERGVKPVLGARVTDPAGAGDAVCLARSREGYANLCRLVTARQLEEGFRLADALPRFAEGLFVLTRHPTLLERLAVRVERASLFAELVAWRGETHRGLLRAARALGVAPVASPEVRFLDPGDWPLHRVLCAVRERTLVSRLRPAQLAAADASFPSLTAFRARFAGLPEALANAAAVTAGCELELDLGRVRFPRFALPVGASGHRAYLAERCEAGLHRRYRPISDGSGSSGIPAEARERLAYELAVIGDLGFAEYFLVVWDIVRFCRMKRIPCVGRGSAASSLVSYALGITNVDPLRYGLPFERFLHRSRADVPDIDLDLCWRRRDEVLDYVYGTYGAERTAMISTHATFQTRLAFREVAKAYGVPNDVVNRLSRGLPYHAVPGEPAERMARLYGWARAAAGDGDSRRVSSEPSMRESSWEQQRGVAGKGKAGLPDPGGPSRLAAAIRRTPECRGFPLDEEPYPTVLRLAERLVGLPRHLGIHSGGVVIGREPLAGFFPLERSTKGLVVTQPEMDAIEALGFVKMDLLGQRALTTLGEAVELIAARRGIRVDLESIPDPDPATSALLSQGRTLSCFQIESPGMRNLLKMLRVKDSDALIAALSLIRPGPAGSGMKERFVRRRRGEELVVYPHPSLEPLLRDTYGIMLYQEDIMRVAHAVAGFTLEEADRLRKALEEGRTPLQVNRVAHAFFRRAVAGALNEGTAWGVWEQMKQFMGYAFCKAHAATYGVLAYHATYLKAHYPAEFYVAVLNNHQGMYPRRAHVEEAKRLGIRFLGPDVHESGAEYELVESGTEVFEGDPAATHSSDHGPPASSSPGRGRPEPGSRGTLRIPLTQVKGLGAETIGRILEARRWGRFGSLREFVSRTGAGSDEVESLVKGGALDSLGRSRTTLLLEARLLWRGRAYQTARFAGERLALMGGGDEHRAPDLPPPTPEQALAWELEHLELTVSAHPLALYRAVLPAGLVAAAEVEEAATGARLRTAGVAIASRHHPTEKGPSMVFLTLEDEGGLVEATLFPDAYLRWGHLLEDAGPFVVEGVVERHHGVATLSVERLERVAPASAPPRERFRQDRPGDFRNRSPWAVGTRAPAPTVDL